jgi:hypothetical protein
MCSYAHFIQSALVAHYIENTCTLAILQIPIEYRKIFQGSESTDLLEKSKNLGRQFYVTALFFRSTLQFFSVPFSLHAFWNKVITKLDMK